MRLEKHVIVINRMPDYSQKDSMAGSMGVRVRSYQRMRMAVSYYAVTGCLLPACQTDSDISHIDIDSYEITGICCRRLFQLV